MAVGFHDKKEKNLLQLSFCIAGLFVFVAFGFAIITESGAILFDGVYSLIAFFMALLTLKVANLVQMPDDDRFHFGYTAIEPTLNLFKSIIIILTCLYAVVSSINTLVIGGNAAQYDAAILYGLFATLGCFAISIYMKKQGNSLRSDLVSVDANTWFIDGVLSAAILLGFAIAFLLQKFGFAQYAPYVDPILLIVLGLTMLPVPIKIMLESLNEVINKAPPEAVTLVIEKKLKQTLSNVPYKHVEVRISKQGRDLYILVHIIVEPTFGAVSIMELDIIRKASEAKMRDWNPSILMDIMFICDPSLAD